jgi:uncharacterized protein YdaU (DUF1376 family)
VGLKFYKRDPEAFLDGVEHMTLEEIGAYTILLDLMYVQRGPLADNPQRIAARLGCDVRVWKRLRTALIRKGKIVDNGDGYITNRRVEKELHALDLAAQLKRKVASTGGQVTAHRRAKSLKNMDDDPASAQAGAQARAQVEYREEREDNSLRSLSSDTSLRSVSVETPPETPSEAGDENRVVQLRPSLPVSEAVSAYNRIAEANGWRKCREVNAKRRAAISARLRKRGLEGWNEVLALAARAEWVNNPDKRGKDFRDWKPNLDWFARDATFVQLLENVDEATMIEVETDDHWAKRITFWRERGTWLERWGPAPGEPGCRAPAALIANAG